MTAPTASAGRPAPVLRARRGQTGRRIRRAVATTGTYVLLVAIGAVFVMPFVFMLSTSLKTSEEVFRYPPQLLPSQPKTTMS